MHLSTNCVLIMKAPDWKVSYFNTDSKVLYESDPKNWQGKSSGFLAGLLGASRFLALTEGETKINAQSIAGLHCNETKMVRIRPLPTDRLKSSNELKSAKYYGTTDLALPQTAAFVVQRYYRIPTLKDFPVRVEIFDRQGRSKNEVNTISCERLVCPPSWLTVPAGYRRVTSEEAVLAGQD